eukprot:TRINITY_DN18678_c0_g1_i1.p1 TRINITY_DN18678_c0_g1~~TRINITY_DN18678_c0_g1_i1.p1  ORF type:complete len:702 (-),score=219.83 TRINITY_DN18678_c0_g1_i1:21-2126(-)
MTSGSESEHSAEPGSGCIGAEEVQHSTGILVQSINHATGKNSWRMMPPDYDYNQELARAAFADMLHDSERNQLYYAGLRAAIRQRREAGLAVHVLDIGTGTGLLSMMAATEGADSIVACEEFGPMADCAAKVIADNGFADKIKLVRKRSTELTVGPGKDLEQRANILVTEVFDTELIGEGAIGTYNHANKYLLSPDRLVVPGIARIYAQVVSSAKCSTWSRPHPIQLGSSDSLSPAPSAEGGYSSLALHDLQLSQLDQAMFTPISAPTVVFEMDLSCKNGPLPTFDQSVVTIPALATGSCDAVFMWWDCWTDPAKTILLSCAPSWAIHHTPPHLPWRDHWMQAVYYPRSQTVATAGQDISLVSCHDEYSLWFDVRSSGPTDCLSMPSPSAGVHMAMSRTRLGQLNNETRNSKYATVLSKIVSANPDGTILCLSEQSVLALMAAKLGATKVLICCENNNYMRDYIERCARHNNIQDRISVVDMDWLTSTKALPAISTVIGEPHFTVSVLPWHNLLFWFSISSLNLPASTIISPCRAKLFILPVHYVDLWKIRAPLGTVEGFKMTHFDNIIESASNTSDQAVEPHPLWEYPCVALGKPVEVLQFDLTQKVPKNITSFSGDVNILEKSLAVNGVALWMEWSLDQETVVSGGPVGVVEVGKKVAWDMDSKQGVHLVKNPSICSKLRYQINFIPREGDLSFKFDIE